MQSLYQTVSINMAICCRSGLSALSQIRVRQKEAVFRQLKTSHLLTICAGRGHETGQSRSTITVCPSTYCIKMILNQRTTNCAMYRREDSISESNISCASVCQNWKKSAIKRQTSCVHQQQHFQIVISLSGSFSFCLCNLYLTLSVIFASLSPRLTVLLNVALPKDDNQSRGCAVAHKGQRC